MHKMTTDSKIRDAFQHCLEHFVDFVFIAQKNFFLKFLAKQKSLAGKD